MFKINALENQLGTVSRIQVSRIGEIYVCTRDHNLIKIDVDGSVSIVLEAGCYKNDGKPGNQTSFRASDFCLDEKNEYLYVAGEHRILKVELNGNVSLVAGDGTCGVLGNDKLAIDGQVEFPHALCEIDGELFFCDMYDTLIRKIDKNEKLRNVTSKKIYERVAYIHKTPTKEIVFFNSRNMNIKKIHNNHIETVIRAPENTTMFQIAPNGDVYVCIRECYKTETHPYEIRKISKAGSELIAKGKCISTFTISPSGDVYYSDLGIIRKIDKELGDIPLAGMNCNYDIDAKMCGSIVTNYDECIDTDPIYEIAFPLINQLKKIPGNLNTEIIEQLDKLSKCEIRPEEFVKKCESYNNIEIVDVFLHIGDELKTMAVHYMEKLEKSIDENDEIFASDVYENILSIHKEHDENEGNIKDKATEILRKLRNTKTPDRSIYSHTMDVLLDKKQSYDIMVICGDKEIPAHRPVLAKSVMLKAMFDFGENSDYCKSAENKYILKLDENFSDVLPLVISYCYGTYVRLDQDNMDAVVKYIELAQMYELYELMEHIYRDYVKLARFSAKKIAEIMNVVDPYNGSNGMIVRHIVAAYLERKSLQKKLIGKSTKSEMHELWLKRISDIQDPKNQKTNKRKKEMKQGSDKKIAKKLRGGLL